MRCAAVAGIDDPIQEDDRAQIRRIGDELITQYRYRYLYCIFGGIHNKV